MMMLISTVNILKYILRPIRDTQRSSFTLCLHCFVVSMQIVDILQLFCSIVLYDVPQLLFNVKIMFLSTVFTSTMPYIHILILNATNVPTFHSISLPWSLQQALFADKQKCHSMENCKYFSKCIWKWDSSSKFLEPNLCARCALNGFVQYQMSNQEIA